MFILSVTYYFRHNLCLNRLIILRTDYFIHYIQILKKHLICHAVFLSGQQATASDLYFPTAFDFAGNRKHIRICPITLMFLFTFGINAIQIFFLLLQNKKKLDRVSNSPLQHYYGSIKIRFYINF